MNIVPIYQIDAFTSRLFGGNPAAVVPLDNWLTDTQMQAIAAENNLSETAFFVKDTESDFALRWFTPAAEIQLCGHATLATAWYLFEVAGLQAQSVSFATLSGELVAQQQENGIRISLPTRSSERDTSLQQAITDALGIAPMETWRGANAIAFFNNADEIANLKPDFAAVKTLHPHGLIVTAPGEDCDFVSRYFAPSFGIDEDPVTGSAHADLMPLWAQRLGRNALHAKQLSARGGELLVELEGGRVSLTGQCVPYLRGEILLPS